MLILIILINNLTLKIMNDNNFDNNNFNYNNFNDGNFDNNNFDDENFVDDDFFYYLLIINHQYKNN